MDHLCYLCLVFVMLLRLLIAALWSNARKGMTSWPSFVMFNCFFTFPCGVLGQVWYLIVSIPDICQLSYFAAENVLWLFLAVPWVGLQCVISVFLESPTYYFSTKPNIAFPLS